MYYAKQWTEPGIGNIISKGKYVFQNNEASIITNYARAMFLNVLLLLYF